MAEYIKRADTMTICERHSQHCFEQNDSHGQHIADGIFDDIVELPTADVVEVVRCKDCKNYVAEYCTRDIKGRTNMFYMQPTDFCSYGEKRSEGK